MIRLMTEADIVLVVLLEEEAFNESLGYDFIYKEIKEHDFAHYFVLEEEKTIIGYIGLWINDEIGQVVNFLVKKSNQNQGYGRKLLEFAMTYFKEHGVNIVSLEVRETNLKAISLYKALGFYESHKRKNYYQTEDALVLLWRDQIDYSSGRK